MPWQEVDIMSLRADFVNLALQPQSNISDLCRRFDISRKTGYKWLNRFHQSGFSGLRDHSKRPHNSPGRYDDPELLEAILYWRNKRGWGGRKIRGVLEQQGIDPLPCASTISNILKREGCIGNSSCKNPSFKRFESPSCNDLWQMDFKGPIKLRDGKCEPLTVLDDHSRFSLGVRACHDKSGNTVKSHLADIFRIYGMPWQILADNGNPWGWHRNDYGNSVTHVGVWLMSLGIRLIHSRPYHPQTCGKDERFHRTLKQELVGKEMNCKYRDCQKLFNDWRTEYNTIRPHESLDMATPSSRYCVSDRTYPEKVPEPEYGSNDIVRLVNPKGRISFKGTAYGVSEGYRGCRVAIRPTIKEHIWTVHFYRFKIAELDIKNAICKKCRK